MRHYELRTKLILIISILILTGAESLSAAELPERGWTIGPSLGVIWGTAYEIVYETSGSPNVNDYLSLLTWEINPALTVGIATRWESGNQSGLDLDLNAAIQGLPAGEMWDYDWLDYNSTTPTYWSVSDVQLTRGFLFDVVYDWTILTSGIFSLQAGVGFHFDWWAWTDSTKDSSYGLETGVNGINYSTVYNVPLAKLNMKLDGEMFFGGFQGRIGPVIAFSHDHHRLRTDPTETGGPDNVDGLHFYDSAFGGPWLDFKLQFGFRTKGRFSLSLDGEYAWLRETRGNTIMVSTDGVTSPMSFTGGGGFSFRRIGVSVLASWNLSGS